MDRLDRLAAEAKAAGVSYGKLMAARPVVPIAPKAEHETVHGQYRLKYCKVCGKQVEEGRRLYCSLVCACEATNRRRREKRSEGK